MSSTSSISPSSAQKQAATLARLRARIADLEGGAGAALHAAMPLGVAAIDGVLPGGGAALGALHEIMAEALKDGAEHGAAAGFAAYWLGRLAAFRGRPVLWVSAKVDLYAPALAGFGLTPDRLVVVQPRRSEEILWAMEEGVRCRALAGLVGELPGSLDFTAARRLQLAARDSGVAVLLLHGGGAVGPALTRWRIGPAPGAEDGLPGLGAWRWRVELTRCRGCGVDDEGVVGRWLVEGNDATRGLRLAAPPGDGSAGAQSAGDPEPHRRVG